MITECSKCGKKDNSMLLRTPEGGGICMNCMVGIPDEDKSMMFRAMSLKMLKDAITESGAARVAQHVKVQFFEDAILMTVRDQMNKFFKQEKITKDRIVEIKYIKDRDRYSVMIVYE